MKYNHAVKYNGVIYPTGADVPVVEEVAQEEVTQEEVVQEKVEESLKEEVKETKQGKTKTK